MSEQQTTMQVDVPTSITREAIGQLLGALGLNFGDLKSFRIHREAIEVETFARNSRGHRYTHDGIAAAVHTIMIPIVDPAALER